MISKEKFRILVDSVCVNTGKTQEQLATEMGYGKNYISEVLSPTGKITKKFESAFVLKYQGYLDYPKNSFPVEQNLGKHTKEKKLGKNTRGPESEIANEALMIIAKANDKLAESNLVLSRSNEELVHKIRISSVAEEDKYTLQESVYLLMGLREYMTELASVVMNKSALEVNQTLNSKVMAAKKRVENKDTPVVLSK
jgi:hypothetical protein